MRCVCVHADENNTKIINFEEKNISEDDRSIKSERDEEKLIHNTNERKSAREHRKSRTSIPGGRCVKFDEKK